MGVYIKGMEMPKSCRACRLKMNCDDCEGFECVCLPLHTQIGYLDDLFTDKRRDDCPLVPVPPHGRLIDADALCRTLRTLSDNEYTPEVFANWIENYIDTIIPAEEDG